jgi:hypothetical protein
MAQLAMEKETAAMLKEAEVIETGVETQSTSGGSSEQ